MRKDKYVFEHIGNVIWRGEIEDILLSNEKFVEDLDNFPGLLMSQKFKDKTIEERKGFLHHEVIGNTCRTYVLDMLALKHLQRILDEEADAFLDFFWAEKIKNFKKNEAKKS